MCSTRRTPDRLRTACSWLGAVAVAAGVAEAAGVAVVAEAAAVAAAAVAVAASPGEPAAFAKPDQLPLTIINMAGFDGVDPAIAYFVAVRTHLCPIADPRISVE
jgi:hypothetical protein